MILHHRLRKSFDPRPGSQGRESERMARASDIVQVMVAGLLVIVVAFRILHG